jgi:CheY-like chemotaxis protein
VDLSELMRQAKECVVPEMTAKGHRLEVRLPEEHPGLYGDPVRLVQVLQNLLSNAAKYTPDRGHIVLSARISGDDEVEIEVSDNGIGITTELLPHVFDLFRQGERGLDRSQSGLGVGLTLVSKLVKLHGGRVLVQSAGPGQGSSFSVRLPLTLAVKEDASPVETVPWGPVGLRVLVVEDDPAVADSMVVSLEFQGHEVRSAGSGETALDLLKTFRPEVVLLDIGLPGEDGYCVARRIRELPEGRGVPLLALSGYGDAEAITRSREAGIDQHLVKPVHPDKLRVLLDRVKKERQTKPD